MTDPTLLEIMQALADQIETTLASKIDNLQVNSTLTWNPTPPAVDIYPADPFQEQIGMGKGNKSLFLEVRARVNTPDHEGAQELLLSLMDPNADTSMEQAILGSPTLSGKVSQMSVSSESPSNYGAFADPGGGGALLGCTWTVRVIP